MLYQRRAIPENNHNISQTSSDFLLRSASSSNNEYDYYYDGDGNNTGYDEEEKRRTDMYERSCGIAQFFVNPWLFIWLKCQKVKVIIMFLCKKTIIFCSNVLSFHSRFGRHRYRIYNLVNQHKLVMLRHKRLFILFFAVKIIIILLFMMIQMNIMPTWKDDSSILHEQRQYHPKGLQSHIPIQVNLYAMGENKRVPSFKSYPYDKNIRESTFDNAPNYGGLNITLFSKDEDETTFQRTIVSKPNETNSNYVHIYKHYEFKTKTKCEDVSWRHLYHPNCNFFHEIHSGHELDYINSGFYRDVFSFSSTTRLFRKLKITNEMALKVLRLSHNVTHETINEIWTEALVMERLISSPRIMDIYGHCSTSVASEFVQNEIENEIVPHGGYISRTDDQQQKVQEKEQHLPQEFTISQNSLNATQKLEIALDMALSIADLHGFKGGVIVHDDIQLRQWLRSSDDGRLILGDFNRARILRWNDEDKKYCKFRTGTVFGDYRSPEEYKEEALDEKVDIYSFGNNIYALLTGLWPFYDISDTTSVQSKIKQSELPYIDDQYRRRSKEERVLVEVMTKCWEYDALKRVSIFEVIEILHNAKHNT